MAFLGKPNSTIFLSTAKESGVIRISFISVFGISASNKSVGEGFLASPGRATLSHFATKERVVPWIKTDVTEMKNTILKIKLALSIPARRG